jgi:hypothetical protein
MLSAVASVEGFILIALFLFLLKGWGILLKKAIAA